MLHGTYWLSTAAHAYFRLPDELIPPDVAPHTVFECSYDCRNPPFRRTFDCRLLEGRRV